MLTDAVAAITRLINHDQIGHLMNSTVASFEAQIQQIAPAEQVDLGMFCNQRTHSRKKLTLLPGLFTLESARLYLRAFHFFMSPSPERDAGLVQAYFIACSLLQTASRLDKEEDFANYNTVLQDRAIAFSAMCILRIRKSSLHNQIDLQLGEAMFFEAIRLHRKRSIQNNDLDARSALILTQLWSSTQAFRFKDGSINGLRLLLRGRLVGSLLQI